MQHNHLLKALPSVRTKELECLVENRRAYTLRKFELSIFDTHEARMDVPLQFNDFVIANMIKGKKVMHLQEKVSFDYYPGETLLLPARTRMTIDFPDAQMDAPTQCTAISVSKDFIEEVQQYLNGYYPKQQPELNWTFQMDNFHFSNDAELERLTNQLFQISLSGDLHKEALADLVLKELMVRIMQKQGLLALRENTDKNNSVFAFLKTYIQENIGEKLSLEKLCKQAGMSKSTLSRAFRTEFGLSPMEYVIRERLAYSKRVLAQSMSVKIACFAAGFSDINYFVRLFRQREGMTPGHYILSL